MLQSLDKIVLYVSDLQRSAAFYELLGFTVVSKGEVVYVNISGMQLEMVTGPTEIGMHDEQKGVLETARGQGMFLLVAVEDADTYYNSLLKKGIKPTTEPRTWGWGRREFVVKDLNGYRLVFYQEI